MSRPTRSIRSSRGRELRALYPSTTLRANRETKFKVSTTEVRELLLSVVRRQSFCQILPANQDESLIFQEFLELCTLHGVEVVLPPCRPPVRMIPRRSLHFVVVIGKMHDQ